MTSPDPELVLGVPRQTWGASVEVMRVDDAGSGRVAVLRARLSGYARMRDGRRVSHQTDCPAFTVVYDSTGEFIDGARGGGPWPEVFAALIPRAWGDALKRHQLGLVMRGPLRL